MIGIRVTGSPIFFHLIENLSQPNLYLLSRWWCRKHGQKFPSWSTWSLRSHCQGTWAVTTSKLRRSWKRRSSRGGLSLVSQKTPKPKTINPKQSNQGPWSSRWNSPRPRKARLPIVLGHGITMYYYILLRTTLHVSYVGSKRMFIVCKCSVFTKRKGNV